MLTTSDKQTYLSEIPEKYRENVWESITKTHPHLFQEVLPWPIVINESTGKYEWKREDDEMSSPMVDIMTTSRQDLQKRCKQLGYNLAFYCALFYENAIIDEFTLTHYPTTVERSDELKKKYPDELSCTGFYVDKNRGVLRYYTK